MPTAVRILLSSSARPCGSTWGEGGAVCNAVSGPDLSTRIGHALAARRRGQAARAAARGPRAVVFVVFLDHRECICPGALGEQHLSNDGFLVVGHRRLLEVLRLVRPVLLHVPLQHLHPAHMKVRCANAPIRKGALSLASALGEALTWSAWNSCSRCTEGGFPEAIADDILPLSALGNPNLAQFPSGFVHHWTE
jgi:hypothetical protein